MSLANSDKDPRRPYRSPLRDEQAAATHDRILEALVRTMANGVTELSVPAVAREAGVSVATVYRHFPNKETLLTALPDYFARQSSLDRESEPATTWDECDRMIRRLFGAYERFSEAARAAMVSQLGRKARQAQLPERIAFSRATIVNLAPGLDGAAIDRVNRLALVLVSSTSFQMYEALGLDADDATEHVVWAIKAAIEAEEQER